MIRDITTHWRIGKLVANVITVVLLMLLIALAVMLPLSWGRNQELKPDIVESRLTLGMSVTDAEFALALRPGTLRKYARKAEDGRIYARATETGRLAVYIYPQHEITLIFDADDRLEEAFVHYCWNIEKRYMPLRINDPLHKRKL